MNPKEFAFLHIFHLVALLVLTGYTFFAFAGPADTRRRVLAITGIASLLVLLSGIRMWQGVFGFTAMGWIFGKLGCWLGLTAMSGLAFRKRESANTLMVVTLVLLIAAVSLVYLFDPRLIH